jgi:curved DNA-binding protein
MVHPYRILGVPHTASQEEIRSAYHRLARRYHPDLNTEWNAEARMRALNGYEILSDPHRHRRPDRSYKQRLAALRT